MAKRTGTPVQLYMPAELFERIRDYQFANRINSRTEAIRMLLEHGLTTQPQVATDAA